MQNITEQNSIRIINHPVVLQNLALMRDVNSDCATFREAAKKITLFLMYEASKNLPKSEKNIMTPLENTEAEVISNDIDIIISPILRAGLIFTDAALDILPQAKVFHIGMYRNEKTLKPVWYYNKLPEKIKNPTKTYVYVTDPMLATGGSLLETIKLYADKNIPQKNITAVCIVTSTNGIDKIMTHYPDINLVCAAVDRALNDKGYILPGLGDAGDRIFNTI